MNGITKNDLSGGKVVLEKDALIQTAAIAVYRQKEEVARYLDKMSDALLKGDKDLTGIYLNAMWLSNCAKDLAIAADTYAALLGSRTREELEVI